MVPRPSRRLLRQQGPRRVRTDSQFVKCEDCNTTLFIKDLEKNLHVCPECERHFRIGWAKRLEIILDEKSFKEQFEELEPSDPLKFKGRRKYVDRLKDAQKKSGLTEAVVCGTGKINGSTVAIGVMDFGFMAGSMGSVVGEKISLLFELALAKKLPVIICSCSGGARMDEGALAVMQMAKTSAAVQRHREAGLFYFSILTDPTTAGVSASFAFLGDIIIGEPGAMIGFVGPRVLEQTVNVKMPKGFQSSGFQLEHGQIDLEVKRKDLRSTLTSLLEFAAEKKKSSKRKSATTSKSSTKPKRKTVSRTTRSIKKKRTA